MYDHDIDIYLARHVPLARFMGIRLKHFDATSLALAAPLGSNTNDKGTAFAGALATILTLSGWAVTYLTLQQQQETANLVIVDSTIRYLRPVREEIVASCLIPDKEASNRLITTYRERGKASWELQATVEITGGITAATFRGRYAASRPG